jgi:hypothetical protein
VRQYGFRRDRLFEIPGAAVTTVVVDESTLKIHFRSRTGEAAIDVVSAAEVGGGDNRATMKQTAVDVVALRSRGSPSSLHRMAAAALDEWYRRGPSTPQT